MSPSSKPSALADLQYELATGIASVGTWPPSLVANVVPGGTLDAAGALDVYRRGYVVRLTDQLGETYASVWRVLGDEDFFAECSLYIAEHISSSYNLSDYGRSFPEHLRESAHSQASPFLADLARLELTIHDVFHAVPHRAVTATELAELPGLSEVRFRLGAAVALFESKWAVCEVYQHRDDVEPPSLKLGRPQWAVVSKAAGQVWVHQVSPAAYAVLDAILRGETVGESLELGAQVDAGFGASEVASLFELISRAGLVENIQA